MPEDAPSLPPLSADQPWRGTHPYTEEDRTFFHGRRRETEELRRLLDRENLVLLTGATGTGKTSLVRAGLIPLLNADWLPVVVSMKWEDASETRPLSRQVLEALEMAAHARKLEAPQAAGPADTLWEVFHRTNTRWWNSRQRVVTPLIVLEDFEEVFTTAAVTATRRRFRDHFLEELSQLVANRPPSRIALQLDSGDVAIDAFDFGPVPVRILMVVTEEAAPRLMMLRSLFPTLRRAELRLTAFTHEQARDALIRASAQRGLFAEGVIDLLLPRLADGGDVDHPVPPGKLAETARRLAHERQRRNLTSITPEIVAPGAVPAPLATPSPANDDEEEATIAARPARSAWNPLPFVLVGGFLAVAALALLLLRYNSGSPSAAGAALPAAAAANETVAGAENSEQGPAPQALTATPTPIPTPVPTPTPARNSTPRPTPTTPAPVETAEPEPSATPFPVATPLPAEPTDSTSDRPRSRAKPTPTPEEERKRSEFLNKKSAVTAINPPASSKSAQTPAPSGNAAPVPRAAPSSSSGLQGN